MLPKGIWMAYRKSIHDTPKQGQRVVCWVNHNGFTGTFSATMGFCKQKGVEIFILDCGGKYNLIQAPLWDILIEPTKEDINSIVPF